MLPGPSSVNASGVETDAIRNMDLEMGHTAMTVPHRI
jgi:hypothetical protein